MEDILAETQRRQEQAFDWMLFGMPLSASEMKKIWDTEKAADGSLILTGYRGEEEALFLPEKIGKTSVSAVRMGAGFQGAGIQTIVIPACITQVACNPFLDGSTLQEILTAEDHPVYRSADGMLFSQDGKILLRCPRGIGGEIVLPSETEEIGPEAFKDCANIQSIQLPEGMCRIGAGAFRGCAGLKEMNLPAQLTEVPAGLFQGCSGLEKVTLPEGLTSIGVSAFGRCSALRQIVLPEGLAGLQHGAFLGCAMLEEITVPKGVKTLSGTFEGCSALRRIVLPEKLEDLGSYTR